VISPEGLRTETILKLGERIMTPSMTACPPTAKSNFGDVLGWFIVWFLYSNALFGIGKSKFLAKLGKMGIKS